jgi:hypothetical protein
MNLVNSTALLAFAFLANAPSMAADRMHQVRQGADSIDAALHRLAESTSSIASDWVAARRAADRLDHEALEESRRSYLDEQGLTLFRSWPGELQDIPAQQSPQLAYYAYSAIGDHGLDQPALRHLAVFDRMGPILEAANQQLQGSWTYLTTADNWMLLFPFLAPEMAVNNGVPSQQVFYTAADFKTRGVGWTGPYLDLAGAGMMVTAASPAYDGNELLGVASQDITLRQISSGVLSELAGAQSIALLVDHAGLAIAASDPGLESEIERVNAETGAARLYYLDATRLAALNDPTAVASAEEWFNRVVSAVLQDVRKGHGSAEKSMTIEGRSISAARTRSTGWWLIIADR